MTHPPYPGPPIEPDAFPAPPYGGPPHGVGSTRGLAIGAALVAVLVTVLELVEVPFAFAAQDVYLDAADRGVDSVDVWTAYDTVAVPWTFAVIACYVLACLWLYRVRTNVEITHPEATHSRKKGWVWGGWVVPVVALWFPFQIVRDLLTAIRGSAPAALLGWWWAFWLLSSFTSQIGARLTAFGEIDPSGIQALGIVEGVNAALTLVGLVLWLAVVRRVERADRRTVDASV
jgi:hypothetical protein